jgi:toxin ParE1/3/4
MTYRVVFSPEAQTQLVEIYRYIADAASPTIAANFTEAIVACCEGFSQFPHRGTQRDDIRPDLRVTGFRRRASIAFAITGDVVTILGVFYGGQDYEAALRDED